MGSLAIWGGVAGAASGWKENIKRETDAEAAGLDAARETALERLKQANAVKLEGMRQEGASSRTAAQEIGAGARTNTQADASRDVAKIGAATSLENTDSRILADERTQRVDLEWKRGEAQLERELKERLARITSSTSSGSSDPQYKMLLERYTPRAIKKGEPLGESGLIAEHDIPATYDDHSGTYYVHEGDKLLRPGDDGVRMAVNPSTGEEEPRMPSASSVAALYASPSMESEFFERYGFVPAGFLEAKKVTDLERYMQGAGRRRESTTTTTTSRPAGSQ